MNLQVMYKTKYTLNKLIFNKQPSAIRMLLFFLDLKIGYNSKKKMQSQMRNYTYTLKSVHVAYKIFSKWSGNPYFSTQCQSSWHVLIKHHAIFIEIGI